MPIESRSHNGITILDLSGMLRGGLESQSLCDRVKTLLTEEPQAKILIQLKGATFIDSSGVGELIASFTSVKKSGGVLKICGAQGRVAEVLKIVRIRAVIETFDTEDEALASFD